jgi:hypothetical protein
VVHTRQSPTTRQGLSTAKKQEIIAALPDTAIRAEVIRRGLEVPTFVGAAVTGTETELKTSEFEKEVAVFLDPETAPNTTEQLALMGEFWTKLGYKLPKLSKTQWAELTKSVEAHPEQRLVPAPLLSLKERTVMGRRAWVFPKQQFGPYNESLDTPPESWKYGQLLRDPASVVRDKYKAYALRYKTPGGALASREAYIASLKEAGQAVTAKDGVTWVFPIMDVRVTDKRTKSNPSKLHEVVSPIATPESLIATQLLHQANGTPSPELSIDIVNEAVYQLDEKTGDPADPVGIGCVYWHARNRQINLTLRGVDFRGEQFGVRHATSAI